MKDLHWVLRKAHQEAEQGGQNMAHKWPEGVRVLSTKGRGWDVRAQREKAVRQRLRMRL